MKRFTSTAQGTEWMLTAADLEALTDAFDQKTREAAGSSDESFNAWRAASRLLHEKTIESFTRRSSEHFPRLKRKQPLH